jgi:TPR repeat protein
MRLRVRELALCAFVILPCTHYSIANAGSPPDRGGGQVSARKPDLKSAERVYDEAEQARKSGNDAVAQKRYADAFKELAPLAKQGDAQAEVLVGKLYLMGYGTSKDPQQANKLFRAAAQQGNADAQFFLGAPNVLHHQSIAEGMNWLELSAEQGNQDAQLLLGHTYLQGIQGAVTRDPVQADKWLTLAARNNLPFYQFQLEGAERQISAADIAKGKILAAAWKPKHGVRPQQTKSF